MGIGDDQFLVLVATSVMPDDGAAVTIELAPCGVAPSPRTKEIYTQTAQVEIGMIIHASIGEL